ncbi:MAG: GNAT family N-acetyltransferase [Desulfovibrio sp.]
MSTCIIRQVCENDIDTCFEVESACFPIEEAASMESIKIRASCFPQGFYVAEMDGQVVGQVNSGATNKDDITDEEFKQLIGHDPDGSNWVIFSLSVHPDFQSAGIASLLMREYIDSAKKYGCETILLLCKEELVKFYERFGYENRGASSSSHGGSVWLEMALNL